MVWILDCKLVDHLCLRVIDVRDIQQSLGLGLLKALKTKFLQLEVGFLLDIKT